MASSIRSVTQNVNRLNDLFWIRRALQLAERGRGWAEPNPLVGAVLLDRKGRFVSEGYHKIFGGPHAEVEALKKVAGKTQGGTLYVTLEPCSTHGKTPPCTDLLIQSGIRRVVIGAIDPNPQHKNRGIRLLKKARIQVTGPILSGEVERQNPAFFKFMRKGLPYVALKMAESLDGKIATSKGESKWITSKTSRIRVEQLRACHEAILVGTNTLRQDEPRLRLKTILGRQPRRIFVARDPNALRNYFKANDERGDFLFCGKRPRFSLKHLQIVPAPFQKSGIQILFLLKTLAKEGISSLLVEGGGEMAASFLEGGWVDQVYFFIAPLLIGGRTAKTSVEGKGITTLKHALRLREVRMEFLGGDILVEGKVRV